MTAPAAIPDTQALRSCWHPVAFAADVAEQPVGAKLLDEPVVVWRGGEGRLHAVKDLCIHRGTALSLGWTEGDQIVCPYHGWRYRADGVCVSIPQLPDPTKVPAKARLDAYSCQERYGLIWVALDAPRFDLPDDPRAGGRLLDGDPRRPVSVGMPTPPASSRTSPTSATSRGCIQVCWVTPSARWCRPTRSRPRGTCCTTRSCGPRRPTRMSSRSSPTTRTEAPERRSRYELHLPYTIVLRIGWGGEKGMVYFFASQPVSSNECIGFLVMGRNYDFDQPAEVLQAFEDTIFNQDKRIVESQRPEQVPFDLAAELHLKFDAVAVAYRRAMRESGLATD